MYPYINTLEYLPLISKKSNFFSGYDLTVLTISLCSILLNESQPVVVVNVITLIVKLLRKEVGYIETGAINRKEEIAKIMKCARKKKKYVTPDASFKKSIEMLESPWKREDKFAHFRKIVETMRGSNKNAYDLIVEALEPEAKEGLGEIFGISCVGNTIRKTIKVRKDVFNKDADFGNKRDREMKDEDEV